MTTYIGLLRKDADSDFGVDFPDFPGCITAGSTLEEVREMAHEALAGHIECMVDRGLRVPSPSSPESVMSDPENVDAIPFPVTVPNGRAKAIRVNVTMPETTLRQIDAFAKKLGKSRSALLTEAACRMIAAAEADHAT